MDIEMNSLDKYLIEVGSPLKIALQKLDKYEEGVVFVVNKSFLIGSITHGDVRRALLNNLSLFSPVELVANNNPIYYSEVASPYELNMLFTNGVTRVPIIDSDGKIVRVATEESTGIIPLSEPFLTSRETELVLQVMNSGWISSNGIFVNEFENLFAEFTEANFAISVCNGTQALVLALLALGIKAEDEVIVPALTFGATANAVIQIGATPVFADVELATMGISVESISNLITPKTRAIIPVHLYGQSVNLGELLNFAKLNNLLVIEDCAEAIGTKFRGKHVGIESDAGTFSFYGNKTITTGEGGMVLFKEKIYADRARLIKSHGFTPEKRYWHNSWGTNFRLTNLQAAIGVAQMERIQELVRIKQTNALHYQEGLFGLGIAFPKNFDWSTNSFWLNVIFFFEGNESVEELESYLSISGIETRRIFSPLPEQPAFIKYSKANQIFPNAQLLFERGLCLPSSTTLTINQINFVVKHIEIFLESKKS